MLEDELNFVDVPLGLLVVVSASQQVVAGIFDLVEQLAANLNRVDILGERILDIVGTVPQSVYALVFDKMTHQLGVGRQGIFLEGDILAR